MRFLLACAGLFLLGSGLPVRGDDVLQQVQRELRTRKVYFGPVDGRGSPETTEAIREFQLAKGLDARGEVDEPTSEMSFARRRRFPLHLIRNGV